MCGRRFRCFCTHRLKVQQVRGIVSPRHGRSTSTRASKNSTIHTQQRHAKNARLSQRQHRIDTTRSLQVVRSSDSALPDTCTSQLRQPQHRHPPPYTSQPHTLPPKPSPKTPSPSPSHSEPQPNDPPLECRCNNTSASQAQYVLTKVSTSAIHVTSPCT
jgi:hypothetical protein